MPTLYQAWQLFQESSLRRSELEARFLAREDTPAIARKCDLPPAAIDLYHDLFFAVRGRLHASDWVACRVIGPRAHQVLTESDTDVLLQIAFILVQLVERGSLLRRLAAELGRPVWKLFGSLKNVARRLLEGVRFVCWEEVWFDPRQAGKLRLGLDSS
jgi:hypothetical protein